MIFLREISNRCLRKTLNITDYLVFQNVRSVIEDLYILLTLNEEHQAVISNVHVVGFRHGKRLNDYLVTAKYAVDVNHVGK